jgi:hypothetical protein
MDEDRLIELIGEVRALVANQESLTAAITNVKDMAELVGHYVSLRDKKEELKRHRTELESALGSVMDVIAARLGNILDDTGQESAKTKFGTAYKAHKTSAKVADWRVLVDYIKKHDAFDLLTKAVAKDAIKQRIDESGEIVPGVDLVTFTEVQVRRA